MTFGVTRAIDAVAVKLGLGFLQYRGSRLPGDLAMRVDIIAIGQLDMDSLGILAAD